MLFLSHTMLFFWNRYELPALHAGLVTPQSPRMARFGEEGAAEGGATNGAASPPGTEPALINDHLPPMPNIRRMPNARTRSEDTGSTGSTGPTAPMTVDFSVTPLSMSDQQSLLPPSYPGPMRSYIAAASTSLQSIRSLASIQSSTSLAGDHRASPNFIFQPGLSFNDCNEDEGEGEEDSYIARVMPARSRDDRLVDIGG